MNSTIKVYSTQMYSTRALKALSRDNNILDIGLGTVIPSYERTFLFFYRFLHRECIQWVLKFFSP